MDRISGLPINIIDSILSRLDIGEAACTSILSQTWRYQWHFLSEITIGQSDLGQVSLAAFVKTIDHILLVHCGSVDKFHLDIRFEDMYNDINKWILYLSRNGIKKLIIRKHFGNPYNLPSSLFSCSELTHLKLTLCTFKPPPAAFQAFHNLKELHFEEVAITNGDLESLLNSCPLLSKLTMRCMKHLVDDLPYVRISAPNLVMLDICNFHRCFQLQHMPLLTSVYFASLDITLPQIAEHKECKLVEFLGSMPSLQLLEFSCDALLCLAVNDVPFRLPFVCPIKHLNADINFDDLRELLAVFCIFRSSPFLEYLNLVPRNYTGVLTDGFLGGEHDFSFRLDLLQEVFVSCFTGTESELKFVELLLANAPALKELCIGFSCDIEDLDLSIIFGKIVHFPRSSVSAALIYV